MAVWPHLFECCCFFVFLKSLKVHFAKDNARQSKVTSKLNLKNRRQFTMLQVPYKMPSLNSADLQAQSLYLFKILYLKYPTYSYGYVWLCLWLLTLF